MNRLSSAEILEFLQCPYCCGKLKWTDNNTTCVDCGKAFIQFRERPVIIRDENDLFPPTAYIDIQSNSEKIKKRGLLQKIKGLIPSKSVNVARERMFKHLSSEHGSRNKNILVVGCGNQLAQLQRLFPDDKTTFIFCDIDKQSDSDIFCDAHELSFNNDVFDGVISTAVLEHVLYPDKVISEICRVLKSDGFVYSEIPFLQSVHEGAYDFTRFTLQGHRRLFEDFKEVESGMVAGPGTALVWSIVDFSKVLFVNKKLSSLTALVFRTMFFWIKYVDYLVKDNPLSISAASCTYFYGKKSAIRITSTEIIAKHQGQNHRHI